VESLSFQRTCLPDVLQPNNVAGVPEALRIRGMARFQGNIPVPQLFYINMVLSTWQCIVSCKHIFTFEPKILEKRL